MKTTAITLMQHARALGMTLEQRRLVAEAVTAGIDIGAAALDGMSCDADVNQLPAQTALMAGAEALRQAAAETREAMPVLVEKDMAANG